MNIKHSNLNDKVLNRLDKILEFKNDPFLKNLTLGEFVDNIIFAYQHLHIVNLLSALDLNDVVLDCSDTGTGKTYTAAAICYIRKLLPFIICPKSAIYTWKKVLKIFGITAYEIINYEAVLQKYPDWSAIKNKNIIFIFDEVHKCKNKKTINASILLSTKPLINKKILLSATLVDKIQEFNIFGYMLGFYKNIKGGNKWIRDMSKIATISMINNNPLKDLIFPYKGSRMSINEIQDFPENILILQKNVTSCDTSNYDVAKISDIINLRHILESHKIELFAEMTIDYLDNNLSVVIFVNFIDSLEKLVKIFKKKKVSCVILCGCISDSEREENIRQFQDNEVFVIICTFGVGGASISLHDLHGRGRVSILSLPESSVIFNQSLGRILRADSKSPAIQVIPFYTNTYENTIYKRLNHKINDLSKINCSDFRV